MSTRIVGLVLDAVHELLTSPALLIGLAVLSSDTLLFHEVTHGLLHFALDLIRVVHDELITSPFVANFTPHFGKSYHLFVMTLPEEANVLARNMINIVITLLLR